MSHCVHILNLIPMKYLVSIFFLILLTASFSFAQLKVSADQRFLQTSTGKPFFWLGDTAWELFHRLDRKEAELYLEDRAEKDPPLSLISAHNVLTVFGLHKHLPIY